MMKFKRMIFPCLLCCLYSACSTGPGLRREQTIADLAGSEISLEPEQVEDGLDRAIKGYQAFLDESEASALIPEATRRLADLKLEKEYGYIGDSTDEVSSSDDDTKVAEEPIDESIESVQPALSFENIGAREAIELYKNLLKKYPDYGRKDEVLYQMSRAYEEMGEVDDAMGIMDRFIHDCANSPFFDEVQFRRAEYLFVRRKFLDAEEAYQEIVDLGPSSDFYQRALYKLGWTYYKQELYEDGLDRFVGLLDYNAGNGVDLYAIENELERKRIEDTFRVISLSFSYLGGAEALVEYFDLHGSREYESHIYENLAEYFYGKRRYADAVEIYTAFIDRNAFAAESPLFHVRIIEINTAGGFPSLVLDGKKMFAQKYGIKGEYWQHFNMEERPEVIAYLKTDLKDLSQHFHALYQNPKYKDEKGNNLAEALNWYHQYLESFPNDLDTPGIHYNLADLLLENHSYQEAAFEYAATAYNYQLHSKSSKAGYASVYAYRQQLSETGEEHKRPVLEDTIAASIRFATTFPGHQKAAVVLGAAIDDLYALKEFDRALENGRMLIAEFPDCEEAVLRGAWLVVAHSAYELDMFEDAEQAYATVLDLTQQDDPKRHEIIDNLASAIYQQGAVAREQGEYAAAADHFLRIGILASTSQLRATADYDAAAALIEVQDWKKASEVLNYFRENYPGHELQHEVTKKMAYVYQQDEQMLLAGAEYERIEQESDDPDVRMEALLVAAQLYESIPDEDKSLAVYTRYLEVFSGPFDVVIELHHKSAEIFKTRDERDQYLVHLKALVTLDKDAGELRTERSRFLAGHAALVFVEAEFKRFLELQIVAPVQANLQTKQDAMKALIERLQTLMSYELADVSSAATYFLAETYRNFYRTLMTSERPADLNDIEKEEYELALEDQAYPFEERSISVHQSNMEFITRGIYNDWIGKSLSVLIEVMPARYGKQDRPSDLMVDFYQFEYKVERALEGETSASDLHKVDAQPGLSESIL